MDISSKRSEWYDESPEPDLPQDTWHSHIVGYDSNLRITQGRRAGQTLASVGTHLHASVKFEDNFTDRMKQLASQLANLSKPLKSDHDVIETQQERALRLKKQGHSMASKNADKKDWRPRKNK